MEGYLMKLNSGDTSFWYSDWTGMGSLCQLVDYVNISDTNLHINQVWDSGTWKFSNMATQLPDDIKDFISQMVVPSHIIPDMPDRWIWSGNSRGTYSAASGYRWLLSISRTFHEDEDWRWEWRASAPAKVQLLLWLILHDALPTNDLRLRRGLTMNGGCQRCSGSREHTLHVLRDWPHSREVWFRCGMRPTQAFFRQQDMKTWIHDHTQGNMECIFLAGVWWLWCWRNNRVLVDDTWDAIQVTRRVNTSAQEYIQFLHPRKVHDVSGLPLIRWLKPPQGVLKLNVDGSYNPTNNMMCTGGLLRDSNGDWCSGFSTMDGTGDALLAVKHGLMHAWQEGARVIVYESDSTEVVNLLTENANISFHVHGAAMALIMELIRRDWCLKIEHVSREANMCADHLAKNAIHQAAALKI